jgi:DNA-directed RNA polymerase subunit RPC12/RpoP
MADNDPFGEKLYDEEELACPECDSTDVEPNSDPSGRDWRCMECDHEFDTDADEDGEDGED